MTYRLILRWLTDRASQTLPCGARMIPTGESMENIRQYAVTMEIITLPPSGPKKKRVRKGTHLNRGREQFRFRGRLWGWSYDGQPMYRNPQGKWVVASTEEVLEILAR